MGILRTVLALISVALVLGCEGLPKPKEVDQGKVDRAMEQVEKES